MKFPELIIQNFLAITAAKINLADRGLVAIQGENLADTSAVSNGAGKSTIADALSWCLFGITARGVSGDDVINDAAGKGCMVQTEILDGSITYTVVRYRKHKTGKNGLTLSSSDGLTDTDLTKGTDKLTQIEVDKVIGSSHEVFAGSIYAGQERMPDLPAATDKHLKLLIEEASGVSQLEEACQEARKRAQKALGELDAGLSAVSQLSAQATLDEATRDGAKLSFDSWVSENADKITADIAQVKILVADAKEQNKVIAAIGIDKVIAGIDLIDVKVSGVSGENATLQTLRDEVRNAGFQSANTAAAIVAAETYLQRKQVDLAGVEAKIGTPCDSCGRDITVGEIAATKSSIQNEIFESDKSIRNLKGPVSAKENADIAVANVKLLDFEAGMTDISVETGARKSLEEAKARHAQLCAARDAVIVKAKSIGEAVAKARVAVNPWAKHCETADAALTETSRKHGEAVVVAKKLEIHSDTAKEIVRVFSPSGVRSRILDHVTPFLNAQTAKYLSTLSDGGITANWTTLVPSSKKGEMKEKFSIQVTNASGGKSFKTLSGGEKRKARIATVLALQDLVSTRASKPIDLFIGDEIDDALDPAGLERLMIILEEKARERGSVFVISHNNLTDEISQIMKIQKLATGETIVTEKAA